VTALLPSQKVNARESLKRPNDLAPVVLSPVMVSAGEGTVGRACARDRNAITACSVRTENICGICGKEKMVGKEKK
jgi:hypothetical protein